MPAFNAEHTIHRALSSVLEQSYPRVEAVVCDDASTDQTRQIVKSIKDDRVVLLSNDNRRGPGSSRDRAIEACTGEWITFCDADDEFSVERIEELIHAAAGDKSCVVFDDMLVVPKSGTRNCTLKRKMYRYRMYGANAYGADGLSPCAVALSDFFSGPRTIMKPLFSKTLLQTANASHNDESYGEDFYFNLSLLAYAKCLRYAPHSYYFYQSRKGSLSNRPTPFYLLIGIVNDRKHLYKTNNDAYRALEARVEMYYRQQIRSAAKSRRFKELLHVLLSRPMLLLTIPSFLIKRTLGAFSERVRLAN
jgi:succinoglycan biosynthesis protein ExoO